MPEGIIGSKSQIKRPKKYENNLKLLLYYCIFKIHVGLLKIMTLGLILHWPFKFRPFVINPCRYHYIRPKDVRPKVQKTESNIRPKIKSSALTQNLSKQTQ